MVRVLRSFVRPLRRVAPVEPAGTRPKGSGPTVHAAPIQTDRSAACLPAGPSSFKRAGKSDVQCVCNNTENVAKSCNYAGHETRVNNGMFYKVFTCGLDVITRNFMASKGFLHACFCMGGGCIGPDRYAVCIPPFPGQFINQSINGHFSGVVSIRSVVSFLSLVRDATTTRCSLLVRWKDCHTAHAHACCVIHSLVPINGHVCMLYVCMYECLTQSIA